MDRFVLNLRSHGMFSNVNEVVQQLHLAEASNYCFNIDWRHSCYKDKTREGDPWTYYFKPCFDLDSSVDEVLLKPLKSGVSIACAKENIITPRIKDGVCNPLLLPKNRLVSNRIINKYLVLHEHIQDELSEFKQKYFTGNIIGLHVRGKGRNHGGVTGLRSQYQCEDGVPYALYFRYVNQELKKQPNSKIFACSDSEKVIQRIKAEYDDLVVSYDSTRSEFGEMHANHPANTGIAFSGYKLGMDVLKEAYLLSDVDCLVHGNSNVANFVLCNNVNLRSHYVYQ